MIDTDLVFSHRSAAIGTKIKTAAENTMIRVKKFFSVAVASFHSIVYHHKTQKSSTAIFFNLLECLLITIIHMTAIVFSATVFNQEKSVL